MSISNVFAQQNLLDVKLSYSAQNKENRQILKDIENLTGVNFTYNSTLFDAAEKVSINVKQKTVQDVLNILFLQQFEYKQIGKQILISPKKGAITYPEKIKVVQANQNKTQIQTKIIVDTVRVYDTVLYKIYDTTRINIYDTIVFIDSSDIYEGYALKEKKKQSNISFSLFSTSILSTPIFYGKDVDYSKRLKNTETTAFGNMKTFMVNYKKNNLTYGVGLQSVNYTQNAEFLSSYTIDDESNMHTDTLWYWKYTLLFEYYKFNTGTDSVLIPVYDSTYTYTLEDNPKKEENNSFVSSKNQYRFIGIPLQFGFSHNITDRFQLNPTFNITALFLVSTKGYLPNKSYTQGIPLFEMGVRPFNYSVGVSLDFMYHINRNFSIHCKPHCSSVINLMNKDIAGFNKSTISYGIAFGLSYSIPYELF